MVVCREGIFRVWRIFCKSLDLLAYAGTDAKQPVAMSGCAGDQYLALCEEQGYSGDGVRSGESVKLRHTG